MLDLSLFDAPRGNRLMSLSPYAQDVVVRCNEHGYESLSATVPRRFHDALRIYQIAGLQHVPLVDDTGYRLFEGRLEDPSIYAEETGSGLRIVAYGYQNAFRDSPVTQLWSTQDYSRFRQMTTADIASRIADRGNLDNQGRLYLAPIEGQAYSFNFTIAHGMELPHFGTRNATRITFDYTLQIDAGVGQVAWYGSVRAYNNATSPWTALAGGANDFVLGAATGTVTGSVTWTPPAGTKAITLEMFYNSAGTVYASGNGKVYLSITNLRITTATPTIDGATIAAALLSEVAALNPSQISTVANGIQAPGYDLKEEVYEDMYPADILDKLVRLGDNQVPPRLWQWSVWENRVLRFEPRGTNAQTWHVNANTLQLNRTFSQLVNSAYSIYTDAAGIQRRTATSTDATSVDIYNLTRRQSVPADTTNAAQALVTRDAVLLDGKRLVPQVSIAFNALYHPNGGRVPVYHARPGDTIVVRNLPPLQASLSGITSFRVLTTEYQNRVMTVTPESPIPTLETLLARREEKI